MKRNIATALLTTFALSFAACGSDSVEDKLSKWKDAACACDDKECAEKQGKAFNDLVKGLSEKELKSGDEKKLDKLADDGQDCLKKHGVDVYSM